MKDWQYLETEAAWPRRALAPWMSLGWDLVAVVKRYEIGHFRVPKTLTFKMRLGAQPFFSENEFYLRGNEKWFPYQRLNTYPRFETEARGNSEIAYKRFIHRHRVNRSVATNSSSWFLERWLILTEDLSQILSMVFFSKNMQYVWAFTPRYSNNRTKCYCKQCIAR